jgi:hypothetical protein
MRDVLYYEDGAWKLNGPIPAILLCEDASPPASVRHRSDADSGGIPEGAWPEPVVDIPCGWSERDSLV